MSTVVDAKVVLLGASSVGKTCIVTRAVSDFFDPEQISTVGASFSIKTVIVGNTTMNLRIWDTAGQERFKSLAPMYYQGSQAAVVVFSLADADSFTEAESWVNELRSHFTKTPLLYLVGNKLDLFESRKISTEEAQKKASDLGAVYFECSAKTGQNINEIFDNLADALAHQEEEPSKPAEAIDPAVKKEQKGCAC